MYRFTRPEKPNCLSDIIDGSLYKFYVTHCGLDKWHNITFTLFGDGAPLHHSSKQKFHPIILIINELDPAIRYLPENIIFAGFWLAKSLRI